MMKTWHPAEIPDDTLVYVPGYGETTAGALRRPLVEVLYDRQDATIRYNLWNCLYSDGKQTPWKTGYIVHQGERYPLSIFDDDSFIRLRTPRDAFNNVDLDDPTAIKAEEERIRKWRGKNPW